MSNHISEIRPYLFLGDAQAAGNLQLLQSRGITCVVNATVDEPNSFPQHFAYTSIAIKDYTTQRISPFFELFRDVVDQARSRNGIVFVHCFEGISRSPTLVLSYLMQDENLSLADALQQVKRRRNFIEPNSIFKRDLRTLEARLKLPDAANGPIALDISTAELLAQWTAYAFTISVSAASDKYAASFVESFRSIPLSKRQPKIHQMICSTFDTFGALPTREQTAQGLPDRDGQARQALLDALRRIQDSQVMGAVEMQAALASVEQSPEYDMLDLPHIDDFLLVLRRGMA